MPSQNRVALVADRPHPAFLDGPAKKLLIHGRWVDPRHGDTFESIDPTTELSVGHASLASSEDVDSAVASARRALEDAEWAEMDPRARGRLLLRIAELLDANREELRDLETLENGVPAGTADRNVNVAIQTFEYYSGWPSKIFGETLPAQPLTFAYTKRERIGVCAAIVPWNNPLVTAAWKIAPAMAAGNTVILKPAEQTPLGAIRFGELLLDAGVPDGVVNVLTGFGETGAALVAHQGVDKVSFTGSTAVGRDIVRRSAENLKRVTLECGGKSPNIIFADADLDQAAVGAIRGFCALSGQACVAGSRVFVEESVVGEFVDRLVKGAAAQKVGDPFAPDTTLGPISSKTQFDKVNSYLELGSREGAVTAIGGKALDGVGFFIPPTIFTGVSNHMQIARDEIFGPVASVIPFRDESDALRQGNDTEYGLAASVWTNSLARAHRMSDGLSAGVVWVNTWGELDLMAPFGGYKQSGLGQELGRNGIDAYLQTKTVRMRL